MPPQSPVPGDLLGRPFLLETARRAGVWRDVLQGQRFRRLIHTVYVSAALPESLSLRVDAVRLLLPEGAAFSHHTAAALRGLPVPDSNRVHVTAPDRRRLPRSKGICAHQATASTAHHLGRTLTAPAENFVELAATLSLVDLVILGDAIEYHGDGHRTEPGRWRSDVAKVGLLDRLGWRVVVLTADDLYARPGVTLRRIQEALQLGGHPDVPNELDPAWRQHVGRHDQRTQTGHGSAAP